MAAVDPTDPPLSFERPPWRPGGTLALLVLPSLLAAGWSPWVYALALLAGQLAFLALLGKVGRWMPPVSLGPQDPSASLPLLSIIIPARNERQDLALCLDDLRLQEWPPNAPPVEVIVVDGASTDGTREVARSHPLHPQVLEEPPLPPGWVGKNWACHQGALRARGELWLFLDADVRLAPGALRLAVAKQVETGADLVSFGARIVTESFWERVVMPVFVQLVLLYFLLVRVDPGSKVPDMANGQFMCFRREGYRRCGGHEAVRGSTLEDVRLAQEVRRKGGTVRLFSAPQVVSTRMYDGRKELEEGIQKSFQGSDLSPARLGLVALVVGLLFLLPWGTLALGASGLLPTAWGWASLVVVAFTLLAQVALQRPLGGSAPYGLTYPLACALLVVVLLRSMIGRSRGRSVRWKGREYAPA